MTVSALLRPRAAALLLSAGVACGGGSVTPAPQPAPLPTPVRTPVERTPDRGVTPAALGTFIDSLVTQPVFRTAHFGVLIVDPARGDTLYSRNAGKLFMPASNQKLLTAAVALARLGPDFRFSTTLTAVPRRAGASPIANGVVAGDLVVGGTGDPTFSDHARGDAMLPMRALADSLAARGVRRITGRLLAGPDVLPGPTLGFGWAWDDLDYPYSAGVDELYFNEGFTRLIVRGGARAGAPARVTTAPASRYPPVAVHAVTVAAATSPTDRPEPTLTTGPDGRTVVLDGTIAAGDSIELEFAFRDQTAAFLAAFAQALAERGIRVDGRETGAPPRDSVLARAGEPLVVMMSPPLREIMPLLQKPSQNQIAELLFRTLGRVETGVGSADSGRAVVERQLLAWGAEPDGFAVRDGSGLSRHDYVTPATIVRVLDAMTHDPAATVYYDALPIAGVDGTIAGRMRDTPAQGNVHAKTGFVDKARSLSGYVTTADGQRLLFSLLANNWTTSVREVERVQDAIAVRLASLRLAGARPVELP